MDFVDVLLWMAVAATWVPAHRAARAAGLGTLEALVALDLVALAAVTLARADERAWERLAQEDGIVEWATVFAFVAAAALLLRGVRGAFRDSPLLGVALVCIGAFCLFVAGEEISWGQRLFAFQPPEAFLERNFQQEMNLHNVLMDERGLGFALESKHLVAAIAVLHGVVGPLLVRLPVFARVTPAFPPLALAPAFLAVVAVELTYPVELAGEGAELALGLCFVAGAVLSRGHRRPAVWVAVPLVLGAVVAPLLGRVLFGADEEGTAVARTEVALLAADINAGRTPKLEKKRTIHKRVFTAVVDGYFDLNKRPFLEGQATPASGTEPARRDRRGYFLDPWNNPYWVLVERDEARVVVYSFGPNRQRDTDVRDTDTPGGDDVLVVVRPSPQTDEGQAP